MSKGISKCIAAFNYFDKNLIVLSAASGGISIASFATVIGAPIGIASTSFSFAFSKTVGIVKKLLKTTQNKKEQYNEIVMLARSNLNSIRNKVSKTLIDKKRNYCELKESIRMIKSRRNNKEKNKLIKDGERIGIGEFIFYKN